MKDGIRTPLRVGQILSRYDEPLPSVVPPAPALLAFPSSDGFDHHVCIGSVEVDDIGTHGPGCRDLVLDFRKAVGELGDAGVSRGGERTRRGQDASTSKTKRRPAPRCSSRSSRQNSSPSSPTTKDGTSTPVFASPPATTSAANASCAMALDPRSPATDSGASAMAVSPIASSTREPHPSTAS
jgi:hypothetical protein